jgi:hypothetical protein
VLLRHLVPFDGLPPPQLRRPSLNFAPRPNPPLLLLGCLGGCGSGGVGDGVVVILVPILVVLIVFFEFIVGGSITTTTTFAIVVVVLVFNFADWQGGFAVCHCLKHSRKISHFVRSQLLNSETV